MSKQTSNIPTPNYFTDVKKGEVNELLTLLQSLGNERDPKKKREPVKKVIQYMTLGIDVSRLFSEMVKCVDTVDLILKKMIYLYLMNYAKKNPEMAIMCINTLLNDCKNEDPMVRGLALRSLCNLRLDSILEYIHEPLQSSLTDASSYVRKTGVIGIVKVFSMNAELIRETNMVDTLYNMLRDRDPHVVSNCIVALNEIMATEGGMAINQQIIMHLLNRIPEFNTWGQCTVLDLLSKYDPCDTEETYTIMNTLEVCLRVSNSAVILATAKCFIHLTQDLPELQEQVFNRMKQPLLTLLAGGSHELNYCVLQHINVIVQKCPGVFNPEYRQFYARYNEPTHVKYVKIDIMSGVADDVNVVDIISELTEYVTDVDQEMARLAIQSIAKIAVCHESAAHQVFDALIDFLDMDMGYVRSQTMIVMKNLLRKYPDDRHDVLPLLPRLIKDMDDEEGKCAVIWMIGEYGQDLPRGPYVLESLIDHFEEETYLPVQLELLTACMKMFFKRAPEMQSMLGRLLSMASNDVKNQDLHDRALLYYRLLTEDVNMAATVLNCEKIPVEAFAEMKDSDVLDKLMVEFNSLSVVYGKPSETFIVNKSAELAGKRGGSEEEYDEESEEEEEEERLPRIQHQVVHQVAAPTPALDLLDMDFTPSTPVSSFELHPQASMDASLFQNKWGTRPVSNELTLSLSTPLPVPTELEHAVEQVCIKTMASGDVGTHFRFFFYAMDLQGLYFLVQSVVEKSTGGWQMTIKGDEGGDISGFTQVMKKAWSPWTR